ncbi:MAG: hypothetical protein V3U76_20230 [Granulosicoccus sp.]
MFVSIGFDDNGMSGLPDSGGTGGTSWFLEFIRDKVNHSGSGNPATFDGTPARVTFFNRSGYQESWHSDDPVFVKRAWHAAMIDGHETGNHTTDHEHGTDFSRAQWNNQMRDTQTALSKPFDAAEEPGNASSTTGMGASLAKLTGFRTPYLEYNDDMFKALIQNGFTYDTSVEEGWQSSVDGSNFPWPYTLDSGSPGNKAMVALGFPDKKPMTQHRGLWELGVTPLIIPPDNKTAEYGIKYSIRDRVRANMPWFDLQSGKVTGLDYNIWTQAGLNKAESLATLKYTLDLRLKNGNRAPFLLGAHTDYFNSKSADLASQISVAERQEVIEDFITYALLQPAVRVVPFKSVISWMRNPAEIDCGTDCARSTPADPWEAIVNLGSEINDLQEHTDALPATHFADGGWQDQFQISLDLIAAANASWAGIPELAVSKLIRVKSTIYKRMTATKERTTIELDIDGYILRLEALTGVAFFE